MKTIEVSSDSEIKSKDFSISKSRKKKIQKQTDKLALTRIPIDQPSISSPRK